MCSREVEGGLAKPRERERGRAGGRLSAYGVAAPHIHVWWSLVHHIEVEAEGNHRRMALQLRASTCGDALCSIEVDVGLAKPRERERERERERKSGASLKGERDRERDVVGVCLGPHGL